MVNIILKETIHRIKRNELLEEEKKIEEESSLLCIIIFKRTRLLCIQIFIYDLSWKFTFELVEIRLFFCYLVFHFISLCSNDELIFV